MKLVDELKRLDSIIQSTNTVTNQPKTKSKKSLSKKSSANGTGYSGDKNDNIKISKSINDAIAKTQNIDNQIHHILHQIDNIINNCINNNNVNNILSLLIKSEGLKYIITDLLRNESLVDIGIRSNLYKQLLALLQTVSKEVMISKYLSYNLKLLHRNITKTNYNDNKCLWSDDDDDDDNNNNDDNNDDDYVTCISLLSSLSSLADLFIKLESENMDDVNIKDALDIAFLISSTESNVNRAKNISDEIFNVPIVKKVSSSSKSKENTKEDTYVSWVKENIFDTSNILQLIKSNNISHHFITAGGQVDKVLNTNRVGVEIIGLSKALPASYGSSIFLRVDESHMHVMKALIVGPVDTPYEHGLFEFDILLPTQYPNVPPKVNLCTTGNGRIRFNPNLYNDGKVCLSLLGTWEGPSWNPNASSLLQVLVSIQSLILVSDPFFNEPGFQNMEGTPHGKTQSINYNKSIQAGNVKYAMIQNLKSPSPVFADIIHEHFKLKSKEIIETVTSWSQSNQIIKSDIPELTKLLTDLTNVEENLVIIDAEEDHVMIKRKRDDNDNNDGRDQSNLKSMKTYDNSIIDLTD